MDVFQVYLPLLWEVGAATVASAGNIEARYLQS